MLPRITSWLFEKIINVCHFIKRILANLKTSQGYNNNGIILNSSTVNGDLYNQCNIDNTKPNTDANAFRIITDTSGTIFLLNNGNGFLSNCKIQIEKILPEITYTPISLKDDFTLNLHERKSIPVAIANRNIDLGNEIKLCNRLAPVFGAGIITLPKDSYRLMLKAHSTDCSPIEVWLHLHMDDNNQLKLESIQN